MNRHLINLELLQAMVIHKTKKEKNKTIKEEKHYCEMKKSKETRVMQKGSIFVP